MQEQLKDYEDRMNKTLNVLQDEFASIRAGRANPHVLDKIKVDYYGTLLKSIERAILTSDLGINPTNDGTMIRLVFPELTEERRKDLDKDVKKKGEAAKVAIRNIRRDANDTFKKLEKAGEFSEDDLELASDKIQKLTDKMTEKVDKAVEAKTKEILTV